MNTFSVGAPKTIFDWVAIRDEFREKIDILPTEALSILYGLSSTQTYEDGNFTHSAEAYLSRSDDPIRTRFMFAYSLASEFWETYSMWRFVDLTDKPVGDRPYRVVQHEYNGPEFFRIDILPGEPGYAGDLVEGLHDKVMEWLLEGLSAYPDDQEVIDYAFYLVSRIGMWDTFLKEKDIALMEAAAKKEISFKTSAGGRRMVEQIIDQFNKRYRSDDKKNKQQNEE